MQGRAFYSGPAKSGEAEYASKLSIVMDLSLISERGLPPTTAAISGVSTPATAAIGRCPASTTAAISWDIREN